jgi:hypothetical protein
VVRDPGYRINKKVSNTSRAAKWPKTAVERSNHDEKGAHREDR